MFIKSLKNLIKPFQTAALPHTPYNLSSLQTPFFPKTPKYNSLLKTRISAYHYDLAKSKYLLTHPHKPKGALKNRKEKRMRNGVSKKKANYKKASKYKLKNHKGLIKRIKILGPRNNRAFEFKSPGLVKKMSKKRKQTLQNKKKKRFISKADLRQVKKMIPYFKRQRYKNIISLSY